jgi:DNA-binding transcriptional MerR regulator
MGEVTKLLQVSPSLVRFWDQEFDVIKPKKNKKGNRMFSAQDVENLKLIHHLVKEKGYTLKGAKDHIKTLPTQDTAVGRKIEAVNTLKNLRQFLVDIKSSI